MTAKQLLRLLEWAIENGYTLEEVHELFKRIANNKD